MIVNVAFAFWKLLGGVGGSNVGDKSFECKCYIELCEAVSVCDGMEHW